MKPSYLFLSGCLVVLGACSKPEPVPTPDARSASPAPKPPAQARKAITPERIQEIEASGQSGLWSSVTEVCAKDVNLGLRTMLTWNVKDRGTEKVVVYAVDNKNVERHFGQGGPVDERETGPWLRPGVSFKIRDHNSGVELGSVVIGEKPC